MDKKVADPNFWYSRIIQCKNYIMNIPESKKKKINILIACEESQSECLAFRELGFNAYSTDLKRCAKNITRDHLVSRPDYHIWKEDPHNPGWGYSAVDVMNLRPEAMYTETGEKVRVKKWDLVIAHPPCTFLSNATPANNKANIEKTKELYNIPGYYRAKNSDIFNGRMSKNDELKKWRRFEEEYERPRNQEKAKDLFLQFAGTNNKVEHWCIENPNGFFNRKENQSLVQHLNKNGELEKVDALYYQPYEFGDENGYNKRTCYWLHNLPALVPTNYTDFKKGQRQRYSYKTGKIKYENRFMEQGRSSDDYLTKENRSKSFKVISDAMAVQWGAYLLGKHTYYYVLDSMLKSLVEIVAYWKSIIAKKTEINSHPMGERGWLPVDYLRKTAKNGTKGYMFPEVFDFSFNEREIRTLKNIKGVLFNRILPHLIKFLGPSHFAYLKDIDSDFNIKEIKDFSKKMKNFNVNDMNKNGVQGELFGYDEMYDNSGRNDEVINQKIEPRRKKKKFIDPDNQQSIEFNESRKNKITKRDIKNMVFEAIQRYFK